MSALSGLSASTFTPGASSSATAETMGRKAASVLPPAVAALISTSRSPARTTGAARSWMSRRSFHLRFQSHRCTPGCSRSKARDGAASEGEGGKIVVILGVRGGGI